MPEQISVSAYVVAAICGCWKRESGVNPGIWESLIVPPSTSPTYSPFGFQYTYEGIGGYGFGQWTNVGTPYGRCWNLHQWVTSHGYLDGDGDGQIAFVIDENVWYNSSYTRGNYTTLTEFLTSDSTNLDDLVWDFLANWEGVAGDAYSERLEAARAFLPYIIAHANDDPTTYEWYSENTYLGFQSSEQLGNVMKVYFALNGYIPPTPTKKKKGLPIYMMLRRRYY